MYASKCHEIHSLVNYIRFNIVCCLLHFLFALEGFCRLSKHLHYSFNLFSLYLPSCKPVLHLDILLLKNEVLGSGIGRGVLPQVAHYGWRCEGLKKFQGWKKWQVEEK